MTTLVFEKKLKKHLKVKGRITTNYESCQGCQMVYFETRNPIYIFPILVYCIKKNLATLLLA
jgi:hypothetical protein